MNKLLFAFNHFIYIVPIGSYEQKLQEDKTMKAQNYEKALAKAAEESKLLYSAGMQSLMCLVLGVEFHTSL